MAVEPLYIAKSLLISRLRMTGTSDEDTLTIIDQVIADVRLEFYRRLSTARALEIAALPSVENPTTTDGILRSVADVTELYWVEYKLVCILPVMFIETQFPIQNSFDDVPITRDAEWIHNFRTCLWNSVESGLGQLIQPIDNNTGNGQSFSTGATTPFIVQDNFIGKRYPC